MLGAIALAVALSGTGYAAVNALPRNSVTSVQVKDRSLLAKDFKDLDVRRARVLLI